jgi:hypothetical protein
VIFTGGPVETVDGGAGNKGHATITYQNSVLDFTFENVYGHILRAPSTTISVAEPFHLHINIAAHPDSPRYIDNVRLYSLDDSLSGDFNEDGRVDAADYVVWRDGLDSIDTQTDYDAWRANFGATPAQAATITVVPEPISLVLPTLVALLTSASRISVLRDQSCTL